MKNLIVILIICVFAYNCNTPKVASSDTSISKIKSQKQFDNIDNSIDSDTVRIANDSLEYEIIIIEPGFNRWVKSVARQRGFYSQQFLEARNNILVNEYNNRVIQPLRFDPNLYPLRIDYDATIDYGYEVNYLLYNYFIFFQLEFNQKLGPYVPRV